MSQMFNIHFLKETQVNKFLEIYYVSFETIQSTQE